MVANRGQAISTPDVSETEAAPSLRPAGETAATVVPGSGRLLPHLDTIDVRDPKLAAYIAQMTIEMSAMARAAGFDLLAYFLDMARIEANIQSGKEG